MTPRTKQISGVVLMVLGPLLILGSPWVVLRLPLLHSLIYEEGWALLTGHRCVWFSELSDSAAIGWTLEMMLVGVSVLFGGLWLFCSARPRAIGGLE
jgi:hypothetical protein